MTRRALELLTRLEKQALDRERLGLRAIEEEIAQRREEMRRFDAAFAASWRRRGRRRAAPACSGPMRQGAG